MDNGAFSVAVENSQPQDEELVALEAMA